MILCNLVLTLEPILGKEQVDATAKPLIELILKQFVHKEHNIILENVSAEGDFIDCFEGRLINAGHGNEAMWFLL